jgi:hypothetical protein
MIISLPEYNVLPNSDAVLLAFGAIRVLDGRFELCVSNNGVVCNVGAESREDLAAETSVFLAIAFELKSCHINLATIVPYTMLLG